MSVRKKTEVEIMGETLGNMVAEMGLLKAENNALKQIMCLGTLDDAKKKDFMAILNAQKTPDEQLADDKKALINAIRVFAQNDAFCRISTCVKCVSTICSINALPIHLKEEIDKNAR